MCIDLLEFNRLGLAVFDRALTVVYDDLCKRLGLCAVSGIICRMGLGY